MNRTQSSVHVILLCLTSLKFVKYNHHFSFVSKRYEQYPYKPFTERSVD